MAYRGNAAYQLDFEQQAWEIPARGLSVHEGGATSARPHVDPMADLFMVAKAVIVLTVMLFVLGGARVALTAQTVSVLKEVSVAEATLDGAYDTRTELRVERSALSSADRIQRIATENYGMVYASEVETLVLPQTSETSADDAQSGAAAGNADSMA
jgi:cell division protein FtsL